jgi:Zn-dependent metalloprotease
MEKRKNRWHLNYRQYYKNVPVYHSYLGYTVYEDGTILSLGSDIHPEISIDVNPSITDLQALKIAKEQFLKLSNIDVPNIRKSPELTILPEENDKGYRYYLVYNIELELIDSTHVFSQAYFIDAHNGQVVDEYSNIQDDLITTISGTVRLKYFPEHYYDSPLYYGCWVAGDVKLYDTSEQLVITDVTNSSGYYELTGIPVDYYTLKSNFTSSTLSNFFVLINNSENQLHEVNFNPDILIQHNWYWVGDETNAFYHADWIHDFYKSPPFSYDDMDYQMIATVHSGSYWNGYATGINIGFGSMDIDNDGIPEKWARSSDVIYHEYTHNTIYHLYGGRWIGTSGQSGAMNEGFADFFAISINDDPVQGESVKIDRDHSINYTMSQWNNIPGFPDYIPQGIHLNGLIIGGACWDVRENIGVSLTNELVFDALAYSPHAFDFSSFLDKLLLCDDDPSLGGDNNISNGSPHIDDILMAFYDHEIYPSNSAVPPLTPQNFSGTWYNNHPKIYWTANTDPDFDYYEVYKKVGSGSWSLETTRTNTYYIDYEEFQYTGGVKRRVYYKIRAVDTYDSYSGYTSEKSFTVNAPQQSRSFASEPTFSIDPLPTDFKIHSAFPNPFNSATTLKIELPEKTNFTLAIYDINGSEIWRLNNKQKNTYFAGYHSIVWDGKDNFGSLVSTGVYLVVFRSSEYKLTQKVIFMK